MANKKTILGADVVKFDNGQDGFNPVFRKTIDILADGVVNGNYYAIARLPRGFAPRNAAVAVLEDLAESNSNVTVAVAIGTASDEDGVVDDVTVLAASGTNHKAGTLAIASLVAGSGTVESTTATVSLAPVVANGTDAAPVYIWVAVGSGVVKGKLEVTVSGDQMLTPSKAGV